LINRKFKRIYLKTLYMFLLSLLINWMHPQNKQKCTVKKNIFKICYHNICSFVKST